MRSFSRFLAIAALAGVAVMSAGYLNSAGASSGTAVTYRIFDQDCCNH
ncbi:hypothetical protein [Nonomuraea sp. NPDC049709]